MEKYHYDLTLAENIERAYENVKLGNNISFGFYFQTPAYYPNNIIESYSFPPEGVVTEKATLYEAYSHD